MTLKDAINQRKCSNFLFTLFVIIRFYGWPHCCAHVQEIDAKLSEFEAKKCQIILICKGSSQVGPKWKKVVGISSPLLADESREFSDAIGFKRSLWNLWNSNVLHLLAEAKLKGEEVKIFEDPKHDLMQMGGDILIENSNGKVLYWHESKISEDRPEVNELLNQIPTSNTEVNLTHGRNSCRPMTCALL